MSETALSVRVSVVDREVERLRVSHHSLAGKVAELDALFQEQKDDIHQLHSKVDRLGEQMQPALTAVALSASTMTQHAEQCIRDKERDRAQAKDWHHDNKTLIERIDARTKRLEAVYFVLTAMVGIAGLFGAWEFLGKLLGFQ